MQRRHFNLTLSTILLAGCSSLGGRPARGPKFWRAQRGRDAVAYILGAAEAKDGSWFTPDIERAFAASTELWLETSMDPWPPGLLEELGVGDRDTFFGSLQPAVRKRALTFVEDLNIDRESIATLRPWYAYYRINAAFWRKYPRSQEGAAPEAVLRERARKAGIRIQHEFPTGEALLRYFASMPTLVQSQYVEMLLDFFDDERSGLNEAAFGWAYGEPSSRALDRMRTKTPELYRYLQSDRNLWWAHQIQQLLAAGGTRFVLLGMNHALGPDGVPSQLERIGVDIVEIW